MICNRMLLVAKSYAISCFLYIFKPLNLYHFLMMWNFDEPVKREGTNCIKYDLREETFGVKDVIPMWVADMDFKTPDFIIKALQDRLNHEIFGYSFRPPEYYSSIINWLKTRHNWQIEKEWISFVPVLFRHLISAHWHLHSQAIV